MLGDVDAFLRHGRKYVDVSDEDVALIGVESDRLRSELTDMGPVQQLHGDAHPGNLLRTPRGWVWTDFEESMPGPLGWDLACLEGTRRLDGREALREYDVAGVDVAGAGVAGVGVAGVGVEPFRALRVQAACWFVLLADRFPRYAERARNLLDRMR